MTDPENLQFCHDELQHVAAVLADLFLFTNFAAVFLLINKYLEF